MFSTSGVLVHFNSPLRFCRDTLSRLVFGCDTCEQAIVISVASFAVRLVTPNSIVDVIISEKAVGFKRCCVFGVQKKALARVVLSHCRFYRPRVSNFFGVANVGVQVPGRKGVAVKLKVLVCKGWLLALSCRGAPYRK